MSCIRVAAMMALTLGLAGCGGSDAPAPIGGTHGEVVELERLAMLKTAFAEDQGAARLLILLSPT
ncbi:MAG: hypothetical protein H0W16_07505 [Actinobacteria bacterium]|nr:hypothetical protein [Actinomycetota bacterium]